MIGGPQNFRGDEKARQSSSLHPAVRELLGIMESKFGLHKTSGIRAGDTGSFHSVGKAVDVAGTRMREAAGWVKSSGLYKTLLEGIHNPNLSADSGKLVSSGFWGAETWADHKDHIHLAADRILKTVKEKAKNKTRITGKTTLSLGQIVTLAKQVGFPDPALAAAIAYAESRGKVGAVGDGGDSLGLWQINTPAHPKYNEDKLAGDAFYNARAALAISQRGKNFRPWTQFRTGAYKRYLNAKGQPLPKGAGGPTGATNRSSFADYLALWLDEAKDTPGTRDDLRLINRGLRYWRGVYRRNKASNPSRALDARNNISELRDQKIALRQKPEDEVFTLGGLTKIGKVNVAGLQPTLDQIELNIAKAALTETLDANGNVTPASYVDDLAATNHLRTIWQDLYDLATRGWVDPKTGQRISGPGTLSSPYRMR
jgi:hypothetical protein